MDNLETAKAVQNPDELAKRHEEQDRGSREEALRLKQIADKRQEKLVDVAIKTAEDNPNYILELAEDDKDTAEKAIRKMKKEDGGYFTSIREYRKYLEEEGTIQKDEKSEMKEAVKAELAREREEANAEKARTMLDTAFNDLPESQRAEALTLLNQLRPSNPTPEQAETLISTIRRSIRRPERSTTPSPRSSFMQNSYESRDETDDYEDTVKLYAKVLNVEYTWPEWNKDRISSNRK